MLDFAPEHRARRIKDRLTGMGKATVEDMRSVHTERVSIPATVYSRLLKGSEPTDDFGALVRKKPSEWDGSMERDSVAPTIYSAFRARLHEAVLRHHLGPLAEEVLTATGRGAPNHQRQIASRLATTASRNDTSLLPPGSDWQSAKTRS